MKKLAALGMATALGWAATAENIYYCGQDATYPLNLAMAENWTNELGVTTAPGEDTVGVIDFANLPSASSYSFFVSNTVNVATAVAFKGLRFANCPAGSSVSIDSKVMTKSALKIGSEGVVSSAAATTFNPKLELAESQDWTGLGNLYLKNTVSPWLGGSIAGFDTIYPGYGHNSQGVYTVFRLKAGSVAANRMILGMGSSGAFYHGRLSVEQSGGTVSLQNALELGPAGHASNYMGTAADYTVSGGALDVAGSDAADGLLFCPYRTANHGMGVFNLFGGTVTTPGVKFGTDSASMTARGGGALVMTNGTLNVGANGLGAGTGWNKANTNYGYRVVQRGGTLRATADFKSTLAADLDGETVWDTNGKQMDMQAPVRGRGTFRKTGAGTLKLSDATDFVGNFEVAAGKVAFSGVNAFEVAPDTNCWRWTAAEAAKGKADGEAVDVWTDVNHATSATRTDAVSSQNGAPTVSLDSFNGRPGLKFKQSGLCIPAAVNPVCGKKSITMVAVIKTTSTAGSVGDWYRYPGLIGEEQSGYPADWGVSLANGVVLAGGGSARTKDGTNNEIILNNDKQPKVNDGKPHVVMFVIEGADRQWTINVDGRTVEVTNATASVTARGTGRPCYIGFNHPDNPTTLAFDGEIAELRIYTNALSSAEQANAGYALAAQYGALAGSDWEPTDVSTLGSELTGRRTHARLSETVATACSFCADTLAEAGTEDGAEVSEFASEDGSVIAKNAYVTEIKPDANNDYAYTDPVTSTVFKPVKFVADAYDGHPAIHFTRGKYTALGIRKEDNPIAGKTAYSAAVVFRTTTPGLPDGETDNNHERRWGTTLLGDNQTTVNNSWLLGLSYNGRVFAAAQQQNGNTEWYDNGFAALRLTDGLPHVAVMTVDQESGRCSLVIDGFLASRTFSVDASKRHARLAVRLLIGAIDGRNRSDIDGRRGFDGDMFAFRFYGQALAEDEMLTLSDAYMAKYGIAPIAARAYVNDSGYAGLSATNVSVAAGATLAMPVSRSMPYTIDGNVDFSCSGNLEGTVRVADGGVLDLTAATTTGIGELVLGDGATLKVSAAHPALTADRITASGAVQVVVEGEPARAWTKLFDCADVDIADATFTLTGAGARNSALATKGDGLYLHRRTGVLLIVR